MVAAVIVVPRLLPFHPLGFARRSSVLGACARRHEQAGITVAHAYTFDLYGSTEYRALEMVDLYSYWLPLFIIRSVSRGLWRLENHALCIRTYEYGKCT